MGTVLLAKKGIMGETAYYSTTMKASNLIRTLGYACEMENWADMSIDERMQREIKGDRVVEELVPYIVNDPEWFFGALIIDIYKGWEAIRFQDIQEVCTTKLDVYKDALTSTGFLTLPDNNSLIVLDGQHRLCALSIAIRGKNGIPRSVKVSDELCNNLEPHPEIGEADVAVIFIKHENDKKIRKIFNKVNRYAKLTSKGENIITSEDDMIAIITRAVFSGSEKAALKPINNQEVVNWKSNTIPMRSKMLTTAAAIYTMSEIMLEDYGITPKTAKDEEKLNVGIEYMNEFWRKMIEEVDIFKEYKKHVIEGSSMGDIRKHHLLLKPITQMALAQAIKIAKEHGYKYVDLIDGINQIDWNPENYVWANVLVTNSSKKKMITGSVALKNAGSIIAYMLIGNKFSEEEKENVLQIIQEANDDQTLSLPPVVVDK